MQKKRPPILRAHAKWVALGLGYNLETVADATTADFDRGVVPVADAQGHPIDFLSLRLLEDSFSHLDVLMEKFDDINEKCR